MDLPKRVLPHGSPRGSPRATRRREADENVRAWSEKPRRVSLVAEWAASPERKKVLGARNGGGDGGGEAASPPPYEAKPATSPPSLSCRGEGPYDPKTNYITPRPEFLRYNPEKRREILLRLEREAEDESSNATSSTTTSSESVSSASSARGGETEVDRADVEEEEEEIPAPRGGWARRLLLLLVSMACSCCYIYCMNSSPFPDSEMGPNLAGTTGSVRDASAYQVDSLELRASIEMMGSDNVFEEATGQIVPRGRENAVQLYGPGGGYPNNFMSIAAMGLADACPNVPFGEFTCQIGDRAVENVQNSKEDFQLSEQAPEVIVAPSENAEQRDEVASLNENVIADFIGSTHTADMEQDKSGLVHPEEGEDYPNHSQQLASMEKTMKQENEVVDDGEGLESDKLDQATEQLEYENTAEAAKAIVAMVKSLWPSMKLHLMEILACLSVAAFAIAAAILRYFQRSPKGASVSTRRPEQAPALAPNPRLPVFHYPQSVLQLVQLTVPRVEPPVNLKVPALSPLHKPDLFASFREPVQLPQPKPEASVNLNNSVQFPLPKQIDSGNRPQKIHQDDAGNARIPDSYTVGRRDIDSLRPPVVALLGEFSLLDASSSRGSSRKGSNDHAGDVPVQEPSVTLRKDVVKMKKEATTVESPSARRTKMEENSVKVEKMDATPTPLRRSNRLLNRVTSP